MLNGTAAVEVLSAGLPLSTAVALHRVIAGGEARRREGVRGRGVGIHQHAIDAEFDASDRPPGSLAVADNLTLVVPVGNTWHRWVLSAETVGAVFCVPPLVQAVAVQRESGRRIVSAAERAVERRR